MRRHPRTRALLPLASRAARAGALTAAVAHGVACIVPYDPGDSDSDDASAGATSETTAIATSANQTSSSTGHGPDGGGTEGASAGTTTTGGAAATGSSDAATTTGSTSGGETDETGAATETSGGTTGIDWGVCAPSGGGPSDPFIDCVEQFEPAPEASFGHELLPDVVFGPPEGMGQGGGSLDVASLGCGGSVTVFFDDPIIVDGPGPDFIVFENAFGDPMNGTFSEPAIVSVSLDGQDWHAFPCALDGQGDWPATGCAGIMPVEANSMNGLDPTDPAEAGGDAFDLATIGVAAARYVRLDDVALEYDEDTPFCGASGGFDLDAIAIVNAAG